MFKSASFYTSNSIDIREDELVDKLDYKRIKDMTMHQLEACGWGMIADDRFVYASGIYRFVFEQHKKVIPASAVNEELSNQLQGKEVNSKARAEIKEQIKQKFAEHALHTTKRTNVIVDTVNNSVIVDSTSASTCDQVAVLLFDTFGIQLTVLQLDNIPLWCSNVIAGNIPCEYFCVMDSGMLVLDKQKITVRNADMQSDSVLSSLSEGYKVKELALSCDDVSFTLVDDFTLKSINYSIPFEEDNEADLLIINETLRYVVATLTQEVTR